MGEMADLWDKFFGAKVSPDPAVNLKWIENEQLKLLLKEAHDKMDEANPATYIDDNNIIGMLVAHCHFCNETGYDAQGLKHEEDCILVRIRKVVSV